MYYSKPDTWIIYLVFFSDTCTVLKLQELRYVHEELIKQKTAFQSRLQDRDGEISRLRNQVFACCHRSTVPTASKIVLR